MGEQQEKREGSKFPCEGGEITQRKGTDLLVKAHSKKKRSYYKIGGVTGAQCMGGTNQVPRGGKQKKMLGKMLRGRTSNSSYLRGDLLFQFLKKCKEKARGVRILRHITTGEGGGEGNL